MTAGSGPCETDGAPSSFQSMSLTYTAVVTKLVIAMTNGFGLDDLLTPDRLFNGHK